MKTRKLLLPLFIVAGAAASTSGCAVFVSLPSTPGLAALSEEQVFAMAPPPEWPAPQIDNPQTASVNVSCGIGPRLSTGQLYAAVSVKGRPAAGALPPLNISLVLDRSGSMHGEPFRNMLMAAETFVGQLRDGDRVSVIAFSDGLYLAAPPVIIDANSRNLVIGGIRSLVDGGGTFLSGGLLAGLAQVFGAFNPWQVNQVVLFTDGQPNIGITSSSELTRIAARAAEHGVAVTTIGFGMEHDELLLQGMADASGGNYYYVDSPGDMSKIFQQEAGAILRSAARMTDVDLVLPPGITLEDAIGYDYVVVGNHTYVRIGSVPHDQERFVSFRFQGGNGGQLPIGLVYSDMARRGRFAVSCAPGYDGRSGGRDAWALELAGRAEAASGLADSMAWADSGSEVFVISQIGYTRDIIAKMRERLGPQALGEEDKMLLDAQVNLGLKVGTEATHSFMNGGISGLMNFGKQQAVSNATTAVAYNVDKTFHVRVRTTVQMNYMGSPGTRYVARGTPYKPRDHDASLRFKRARYSSYKMMRSR
ncbi:MAG TPA: VWA domain-containing protein [Polyangia bacterium]|nr:VWA domain-containing protein [Polyangia bacterium]